MLSLRFSMAAICGSAMIAVLASTDAYAQVDELVVTAQKRPESLQIVPVAVSAFDGGFLQDVGFEDIFDLQNYTPGLYFTQAQSAAQASITLRGIGTSGNNAGTEPSVGIFIDGVYRSRTSAGIYDQVDLERIEVLRGPQGTLFGRNTSAGAVSITTRKPEYDFGGTAEVSYGNYDYINARATVTGPIVQDRVAFRLTGSLTDRDGYIEDVNRGTDLNDRDRWALKGQLQFNPTDTIDARLIVDYSEANEVCCGAPAFLNGPTDVAVAAVPAFAFFGLSSGDIPTILSGDDFFDRDVAINDDPISDAEDWGVSLEVNWDIGDVTLTSITGYRSYEFLGAIDSDFLDLNIIPLNSRDFDQSAFTQELRLQDAEGGRFDWVLGFYYFQQDLDMTEQLRFGEDTNAYVELIYPALVEALLGLPSGSVSLTGGPGSAAILDLFTAGSGVTDMHEQDHRSWAFFGQASWDITDKLTLTGGLRYTRERKELMSTFTEIAPNGGFDGLVPITITPPGLATVAPLGFNSFQPTSDVPDQDVKLTDGEVTGTGKLQYFWTPSLQTYFSYARGYKSGGTNVQRVVDGNFIFDPEKVNSYEVGLKGQFFDDRLRLNLAAYLAKYKDFQDVTFVGTGFLVQNAGSVKAKGIELEAVATPTEWLTLDSAIALQDSEFESFESGPCASGEVSDGVIPGTCDRSGDKSPNTPRWQVHFGAQLEQPISNLVTGFLRADVTYRSEFATESSNDPRKFQDGYTTVDARAGVSFDDGRWELSVWGKNLTQAEWIPLSFDGVLQPGKIYAYPNEPRTYGVTVRASF